MVSTTPHSSSSDPNARAPAEPARVDLRMDVRMDVRKRLFIGLIIATSLTVVATCAALWVIPYVGLPNIHPLAPWLFGGVFAVLIGFTCWASLSLVLNLTLGRPVLLSRRMRGVTIKFFLPLMALIGRLVGVTRDQVRLSFIKVNNELVLQEQTRHSADRVLLLMPHCLQSSECAMRLTYATDNCRRCGRCPIDALLALRDRYGVRLAIATGGAIARRIVVQSRPRLIVAVACDRDLASGIQDTYPIPVFGVLNDRPCGPCLDTIVDIASLRRVLDHFVDPATMPEQPS